MKPANRSRRFAILALFVIAVAGWWLLSPRSPRQALRPSETRRGVKFIQERTRAHRDVSPPPQSDTSQPRIPQITVFLRIQIAQAEQWDFPYPARNVGIGPAQYWPMLDEAPWPDLDSSHSLQDLAEALRNDNEAGTLTAFVADAELDDLLDYNIDEEIADPWEALVAMQAAHAKAWIAPNQEGRNFAIDSLDIADAIIEDWPDDPAADYARLHIIQAITAQWEVGYDSSDAVRRVMEIIENTDDILVLEAAMAEIERIEEVTWDPEMMAEIERITPELPPDIQESIAHMAISDAVTDQRWDDAERWADRYRDLINVACDPHSPRPRSPDACQVNRRALAAYDGYRAVQLGLSPTDWRSEIFAVVHECGLQHLEAQEFEPQARFSPGLIIETTGIWVDGWVWSEWTAKLNTDGATARPASDDEEIVTCLTTHSWDFQPQRPPRLALVITLPE